MVTKHITFHTTQWSVVLAAKGNDTKARNALRELCESYRTPILRHIDRAIRTDSPQSYGGRNAEDLTHDFLIQILEGKMFEHFERREARFRSYLLVTVQHFLSSVRKRESATKRGGGVVHLPIHREIQHNDISQADDAAMFDRDWAQTTIDRAIASLGNSPETQTLLPYLTRELTAEDRAVQAAKLNKSVTALKVALYRLRTKFRDNIREQIARTVESKSEIDAELDHLVKALCAPD